MADYQIPGYYEGETYDEYQRRQEEERKKREALNTPVTEKIVTNPDGSQEVTVKGTPEALSSANPNTPTLVRPGAVAPDYTDERNDAAAVDAQMRASQGFGARMGQAVSQAGTNFMNNVQKAPENFANNLNRGMTNIQNAPDNLVRNVQNMGAPAAPVVPDQTAAYNARIAQLESGANPNIGYHDRSKGTAFGTYGLTDAAYADARRRDPSLPADKTKATPAQQTAAMNSYTAGNAQQLQQFGIEPTPANLANAHLLGATGLKRFQETGYLSPQAIANNGGEANLRKIIAQRQSGTGGAASGAAQPPAAPVAPVAQPAVNYGLNTGQTGLGLQAPGVGTNLPSASASAIERYQTIQNKPDELMKFAFSPDPNTPDFLKQRAKDQIVEGYSQQKNLAAAEKEIPNLTPKQAADAIQGRGKSGVGDWMQYLLLKHVGLTDLANQKGEELGIGHKWTQSTITDAAGNDITVEVQTTASGKLLTGNRLDGTPLTAKELNTAGGMIGSKLNLVGGSYVNDKTGEVGRFITDEKTGKSYIQTDTGRKPMTGFRPQSSTGTALDQRNKLIQEMNIKLQGKAGEEAMAIQRDYNKLLVGQGLASLQPSDTPIIAPQIAGGQTVAGTTPVPAVAASTAVAPAPAGTTPVPAGTTPAPAGGVRPTASQIAAIAEAQKQEAQEVGVDLGKVRTNFGKSKDAATRLINQAEELITDPGFSVSVGASIQPGFQFIPGSDRATWKAKHEEVVGQTFLTAIESLKGMGALSDKEGAAATSAISRLKNTDQNEASFKAAVKELQFIVKRGVDRNAEKLGREKPFGTSEPEVGTVDMTPQARAAAELEKRKKEKKP